MKTKKHNISGACKALLSFLLFFSLITKSQVAQADPTKEFLMSCTYGVLAGTLVGAAMLAFKDKPGDSLNSIARGASLGLYAGMLLGVYVVYFVPTGQVDPETTIQESQPETQPAEPLEEDAFRPLIFPTITENKIDGIGLGVSYSFF